MSKEPSIQEEASIPPPNPRWKDWTASSQRTEWRDAFYSFAQQDERATPSEEEVDSSRSWRNVEWDAQREEAAKQILQQEINKLSDAERELYDSNASDFWNKFYQKHNNNFFRPRNYLPAEYPEVIFKEEPPIGSARPLIVEFGCGNGSSFFPLVKLNKEQNLQLPAFVYGFDFSKNAIEYIQTHEEYDPENSSALVLDLVKDEFPEEVKHEKVDVALMVFVLSAIDPSNMLVSMKKIFDSLKPGGLLIFRDYGLCDMTQMRFVAKKNRKIEESFYVRADGTRTYFFSLEVIEKLALDAGFEIESLKYETRELQNRKRLLKMYRVWVTAKFRKPCK